MKKTNKKILFIIIYIGIVLLSTKVYANGIGKVVNDNVRIRAKASTDSSVVTLISINEKVEIISEQGDWYKVKYSNQTGYIRKDMISVDNADINKNTEKEDENKTESENDNQQTEKKEETDNKEELSVGSSGTLKSKIDVKIVPSITSTTILSIEENKTFKILDRVNKWSYIEAEGNSGWVLTSKLNAEYDKSKVDEDTKTENEDNSSENNEEKQEEQKEEDTKKEESKKEVKQTKYVSTELLNVRKTSNKNSDIIDQLSLNDQVTVVEIIDDTMAKIQYNGKTGYASIKYLSDSKTKVTSRSETPSRSSETSNTENNTKTEAPKEEASTPASGNASAVVSYAKQYLGCRYVMGGSSPSGFDCSGFTSYVYKHFGISLSRTSSAQASNGTAVSRSNLQPGDILIFNNTSNSSVGHVGIYIGGNSFIHAANPSKGVIITSLSESYYAQRYVGARRVLK